MSLESKLNILEKFNQINNILNNSDENKIITSFYLSKIFNLSNLECTYILNEYIMKSNNLNNIIIIFSAEILNENGNLNKILIPSYSNYLENIINDKQNTLSFNVYGICNKINNFILNDFTALLGDEEIITRYDLGINNDNKNDNKIKKEKKNIFDDKEDENYYGGFTPNQIKKINNDNSNLTNNNINNNNKNIINNNSKSNINNNNKNIINNNSKSNINNNSKNIINNNNKSNINNNEDNSLKRKFNDNKTIITEKKIKEEKKIIITSSYDEKTISEKSENDDIEMKEESNEETERILRTRKVKKTITNINEDGYLVTKDEMVEEKFYEDVKKNKPHNLNYHITHIQPQKKSKKLPVGQTSLHSFIK